MRWQELRIDNIEVVNLHQTFPSGRGFRAPCGASTGRVSSLVRVSTDTGITGLGSVYSHPDLVRVVVENHLGDMLLGEDPLDVERLWKVCYGLTRWYGRKGVAVSALGGVDVALWDIRGKVLGKPIYKLLGGERTRVPAYASALTWRDDPMTLAAEAQRHLENGFHGMKMRIGQNYEYDSAAVRIVRDTIGYDRRLMVDANARFNLAQAQRLAPLLSALKVFWLEEPFLPEDLDSFSAFRAQATVSIAAGENEFGVQGFRDLISRGLVDIVQPDCSRSGGITECQRIGLLAQKHGLRVATHTWSDAVALVANLHLVASLANGLMVEIDQTGNELINSLLVDHLQIIDGEVLVPEAPGLGIELNPEVLDRYIVPKGVPVADGNYSDMAFGRAYYTPALSYDENEVNKT
jgi:D-galactarolactone cycloisomerase